MFGCKILVLGITDCMGRSNIFISSANATGKIKVLRILSSS